MRSARDSVIQPTALLADPLHSQPPAFIAARNAFVNSTGGVTVGVISVALMLATRPAELEAAPGGLDKMHRPHLGADNRADPRVGGGIGITPFIARMWHLAPSTLDAGLSRAAAACRRPLEQPERGANLCVWLDRQSFGSVIMSLSEELGRLGALHERGVLSNEEFERAKARVLGGGPDVAAPALLAINALRRDRDDRWLGGVCGGVARITGIKSWIWRLLFALMALCAGTGVLIYLLMWILIQTDPLTPGHAPGHPQAG